MNNRWVRAIFRSGDGSKKMAPPQLLWLLQRRPCQTSHNLGNGPSREGADERSIFSTTRAELPKYGYLTNSKFYIELEVWTVQTGPHLYILWKETHLFLISTCKLSTWPNPELSITKCELSTSSLNTTSCSTSFQYPCYLPLSVKTIYVITHWVKNYPHIIYR
jgi:hypothetical protein